MSEGKTRWGVIAAIIFASLVVLVGTLHALHAEYHRWENRQERLIICSENVTVGTGLFAGCTLVPCTEILPTGESVYASFAYC